MAPGSAARNTKGLILCAALKSANITGRGLKPRKTPLDFPTSYGLKHVLERQTGIYLLDNAFKGVMLICGYEP